MQEKNQTVNVAKLAAYVGLADTGGQSIDELKQIWSRHHKKTVNQSESTPTEEEQSENVQSENLPAEGEQPENTPPENVPVEGALPENTPPENVPVEGALPENTPPENVPVEGSLPGNTPTENAPSEGESPENTPSEEKPPEANPADDIQLSADSIVVVKDVVGPLGITTLGSYMICNDNKENGQVKIQNLSDKDKAKYTDGYGFISPQWSEALNKLMHCRKTGRDIAEGDFRHRAFIVRAPFIKGALVECDFHKFLKDHVNEITDIYGYKKTIDNVQIILTESMFKGSKFYEVLKDDLAEGESPWDRYIERFNGSGMSMIIAGSDSAPKKRTSLNYQFLSSLQPDETVLNNLTEFDLAEQKERLELLADSSNSEESTQKIINYLKKGVLKESPTVESGMPQEDPDKPSENSEEGSVTSAPAEDSDYSTLLAHIIERFPEAARTRTVLEEVASIAIRCASDASQGRISVRGDTRILVGDPFVLLNQLAELDGCEKVQLLQSSGLVYAPGMENCNELLLLRNPHVSAFEAIVAKNLNPSKPNKDNRKLYSQYFENHTGCVFINSAIAATLGGADFDGDRAKCVSDKNAISLARSNTGKIYELLKCSECEDFKIDNDAETDGKALPIINIQPFSVANETVADINADFWGKIFASYEKSMTSNVGKYSLQAAQLAFRFGMVSAVNFENQEMIAAAIEFLQLVARMTTVIGLDIDSAKSGKAPEAVRLPVYASRAPLLKFSRYVRDHASKDFQGIELYKHAYADATQKAQSDSSAQEQSESKSKKPVSNLTKLTATPAATDLVEKFALKDKYDQLDKLAPIDYRKKNRLNGDGSEAEKFKTLREVLCKELHSPKDENMKKALKEASTELNEFSSGKKSSNQRDKAASNIQKQRAELRQYLFSRYPLKIAYRLENAIVSDESVTENDSLWSDEKLMPLAFGTNSDRKADLQKTIFNAANDAEFKYDESCIQLAKTAVRWRGARKASTSDSKSPVASGKPIIYGELKAALRKIAEGKKVDPWELGLRLLEKNAISEMQFVLLFASECPPKDEEKKEKEVTVNAEPEG